MGRLTDEMTSLRREIDGLRNGRETFLSGLKQEVFDIKSNVADMQEEFRKTHAGITQKTKAEREAFLSGIRESVIGLQQETADLIKNFADDMAGARRAWN